MRVFISSLISGFGAERQAAKRAVAALRHEPVMAEDFGARPSSPQIACLQGIRECDVLVLVLGEHYGATQPSGLSATHEEYREARQTKRVLAFVQEGVTADPQQGAFIEEVQAWEKGLLRRGFVDPDGLRDAVTTALLDVTVAAVTGPVDEADLETRAIELIPAESRNMVTSVALEVALTAGPAQRVLRPVEIEDPALAEELLQAALFGPDQLFDRSAGNETGLVDGVLVARQERGASVRLDERGSITLRLPLDGHTRSRGFDVAGHMVIVEEVVQQRLMTALGFAAWIMERIDATQRLTHIAIAARISGAEYRAWRTLAQNSASPNSVSMGMGASEREPVCVVERRASLRLDRPRLVEDLLVPLRRQFPAGG